MCSETYVDVLKKAGAKAKLQLYKGKTHTDVFVQVSYHVYPLYFDVVSRERIKLSILNYNSIGY